MAFAQTGRQATGGFAVAPNGDSNIGRGKIHGFFFKPMMHEQLPDSVHVNTQPFAPESPYDLFQATVRMLN